MHKILVKSWFFWDSHESRNDLNQWFSIEDDDDRTMVLTCSTSSSEVEKTSLKSSMKTTAEWNLWRSTKSDRKRTIEKDTLLPPPSSLIFLGGTSKRRLGVFRKAELFLNKNEKGNTAFPNAIHEIHEHRLLNISLFWPEKDCQRKSDSLNDNPWHESVEICFN